MARPTRAREGPLGAALSTSVSANATAFGFSITITISFGALQNLAGGPTLADLLLFGVAAAVAVGSLEAAVTRGFRKRVGAVPSEVKMLGTALNVLSVAAGVGGAMLVGVYLDGLPAWSIGGFAAALVYVLVESAEVFVAERIQSWAGDPEAEEQREESA